MMKNNQDNKLDFWSTELKSLGIDPNKTNELNDEYELSTLADSIKQMYYQDYKTAYSEHD